MKDKLKTLADTTGSTLSALATKVGDLNGDGKIDEQDLKIAMKSIKQVGNQAMKLCNKAMGSKLGKEVIESDLVKDAATGAAVGAAIAIPVPIIGPAIGAAVGAGLGVYKNLNRPSAPAKNEKIPKDVYEELIKFDDLRQRGVITDAEFKAKKKALFET